MRRRDCSLAGLTAALAVAIALFLSVSLPTSKSKSASVSSSSEYFELNSLGQHFAKRWWWTYNNGDWSLEEWIQQYEDEHGKEEEGGGRVEKLWDGVCSAFGW
jgi:hypothetical protein